MYTDATDNAPQSSHGPAGACPECAAPHRHDQRYCLECGAPVSEPQADRAETIDFAPVPAASGLPAAGPPPHLLGPAPGSARPEPGGSATTVIAAVGVLLLAIGVGVLIGRAGGGSAPTSGTPQVITVSAPSTSTTSTETTSTSTSAGAQAKHHAKTSSSGNQSGPSDAHPAGPSVVKKLDEKGGGSYEQKSNNLPNVISTG